MTANNFDKVTQGPFSSWKGDHICLRATNFDDAVAWYQAKLNFRLMSSWKIGEMSFGFLSPAADDATKMELIAGPSIEAGSGSSDPATSFKRSGWHHFCFRVDDVHKAIDELKRRGVNIVTEPRDVKEIASRFALFSDPWGNVMEVIQSIK